MVPSYAEISFRPPSMACTWSRWHTNVSPCLYSQNILQWNENDMKSTKRPLETTLPYIDVLKIRRDRKKKVINLQFYLQATTAGYFDISFNVIASKQSPTPNQQSLHNWSLPNLFDKNLDVAKKVESIKTIETASQSFFVRLCVNVCLHATIIRDQTRWWRIKIIFGIIEYSLVPREVYIVSSRGVVQLGGLVPVLWQKVPLGYKACKSVAAKHNFAVSTQHKIWLLLLHRTFFCSS